MQPSWKVQNLHFLPKVDLFNLYAPLLTIQNDISVTFMITVLKYFVTDLCEAGLFFSPSGSRNSLEILDFLVASPSNANQAQSCLAFSLI